MTSTSTFHSGKKTKPRPRARWDPAARKWYAPAGVELTLFDAWLPASAQPVAPAMAAAGRVAGAEPPAGTAPTTKGIPLSQLLAGVAQIITQAYKAGVWTIVEVVEARTHNGHVFLQLTERTPDGRVLAKADATLWASTANRILPEFERLPAPAWRRASSWLVSARPVFKPPYGFSLDIDAIDPDYTLGDLEARKREISRPATTGRGVRGQPAAAGAMGLHRRAGRRPAGRRRPRGFPGGSPAVGTVGDLPLRLCLQPVSGRRAAAEIRQACWMRWPAGGKSGLPIRCRGHHPWRRASMTWLG